MSSNNEKLFEFAVAAVIEEGGDGDMTICFIYQDHRAVADEFERWLLKEDVSSWVRFNGKDTVSFCDNQESITFTNTDNQCSWSDREAAQQGKQPCTQFIRTM